MDKIIVYVDDAEYALHQLAPMESSQAGKRQPTHWVLVACPPRMTRHISKWVNHTARTNWRNKWAEKLFAQLVPILRVHGNLVTPVLSSGPLVDMTRELQQEHGAARVLDARRPKFGQDLPPVTPEQPSSLAAPRSLQGPVASMGAFMVLAGK